MKLILTSYLGGANKIDGIRVPGLLVEDNGQLHTIRNNWPYHARVLIVASDPNDYEKNDSICRCFKESLPMSNLDVAYVEKCDNRNLCVLDDLHNIDVIILSGGHVPTQNAFFHSINLKERLGNFNGLVIGLSAGSMNSADLVYASPELEGEALDPNYKRWLPGLGLTDINVFPHFQDLRDDYLDGIPMLEGIVYSDSFTREIIAINDGTYIVVDGDRKILCGEAYSIKDGIMTQICSNGTYILLNER